MGVRLTVLMALIGATAWVYWPVTNFEFVALDDPLYVTANEWVLRGLDAESVGWAFTGSVGANWLPATFLSHMLDVEWYGLDAGAHHRTNLILHVASVAVLFGVLLSMTGQLWRSAFVAGLFALHPMHTESVAWVTERKDVLSGLFCFLTVGAWAGYARRGGALRYTLVAALLAVGLTAKGMLVTLPFVLLLLDVWPLGRVVHSDRSALGSWLATKGGAERSGRFRPAPFGELVVEKLPLLALAFAAAIATFLVQEGGGAMATAAGVPLPQRLANAIYSLGRYLELAVWPMDLTVQRPHPFLPETGGQGLTWRQLAGAAGAVAVVLTIAVRAGRAPMIGVGWFVGMLIPVIGVVQVGPQGMADRYSYLPYVGLYLAAVWTCAEALVRTPAWARTVAGVGGLGILCALAWQTAAQLPHWRGSVALFRHAIEVDPGNAGARFSLAKVYRAQDQTKEALGQITVILSDLPSSARAHNAMGMIRRDLRELDAAAYHLRQAIEINPSLSLAYRNLGRVERDRGDSDAAEQAYRRSLELDPTGLRAQLSLARLLREQHRMEEAVSIYQGILREQPDLIAALNGVARVKEEQGALAEAINSYRRLTELRPTDRAARERLRALERRATEAELTPPR